MSDRSVPPFDEARAHRWFAVEANNSGWDLVEKADRSADETERMLHAAHAAWFHWTAVGTRLNELRAEVLLATAYHAAGRNEPALHHADLAIALLTACGEQATAFDHATVEAAGEAALRALGRYAEADARLVAARSACERLTDAEDRAVVERFYPAVRRSG